MRTRIKHKLQTFNKVAPFEYKFNCLSFYITKHHKIQALDLSEPFQVQSQLNTSPVNGNLVLQEAFKPSQVIPE